MFGILSLPWFFRAHPIELGDQVLHLLRASCGEAVKAEGGAVRTMGDQIGGHPQRQPLGGEPYFDRGASLKTAGALDVASGKAQIGDLTDESQAASRHRDFRFPFAGEALGLPPVSLLCLVSHRFPGYRHKGVEDEEERSHAVRARTCSPFSARYNRMSCLL